MIQPTWSELLCFVEDVFQCKIQAQCLQWTPVGSNKCLRRLFTPAIGCTVLEANKHWIGQPTIEHFENLMCILLSTSNACQDYLFLVGQQYFGGESFSWHTFRIFLAFLGEVVAFAVRKGRLLLIDDIVLNTSIYIKDYLLDCVECLGGWKAFQTDCVRCVLHQKLFDLQNPMPSAPSEFPCDPLLTNEHPVGMSSPPIQMYRQPVLMNMDTAIQVLPSQYVLKHKLRPVFSTFSTEEPA